IAAASLAPGEPGHAEDQSILPAEPQWWAWLCILMSPICFIFFGRYFGMAPGTFACVFIAALGDKSKTLVGTIILSTVVTVFGVGLFSYFLKCQCRYSHGGAACDLERTHGPLVRLRRSARAAQSDVLLHRRAGRQHGRRPAGHGPARHRLDPVAADIRHEAGRRHPDAGRRHVRRAIWRRDLLDPPQFAMPPPAGGDFLGGLPMTQDG